MFFNYLSLPIGLKAFKHVFLEKMPSLQPESMSMLGLNLYTSLRDLARIANAQINQPLPEDMVGFELIFVNALHVMGGWVM